MTPALKIAERAEALISLDNETPRVPGLARQLLREAASTIRSQAAEIERLRSALEPFADVAKHDIGSDETNADFFRPMSAKNARAPLLTVGDLRRARAALSPPTSQDE